MGGKSSSATVGYWYHVAFHAGLGVGPIDALLEIRAGDKTAWSGELTQSGTITINQPNLFGGEKDQGGIVGDVDVMFGEATQQPNVYLTATFGNQQPAWRGMSTLAFKGGKYGAMNPYPQRPSYKVRAIKMGWDGDPGDGSACWYPEKAAVTVGSGTVYNAELDIAGTSAQPTLATPNYVLSGLQPTDAVYVEHVRGMRYQAWSQWRTDAGPTPATDKAWSNQFTVTDDVGRNRLCWGTFFATAAEAEAYAQANPVLLYGATEYKFWLSDTPINDNRGGLSIRIRGGDPPLTAMNPAHLLYFARTASDMGREPIANMHDGSFRAAADWFYNQKFGLCTAYDPSAESVDDYIARIEKVSGCSMSRSPVDGLWYLDIANGVYDLASLPILTDDDILDFQDQPKPIDTAVNSLSVTFFDPAQKQSVTPGPVQAMALVDANGVISDTVDYPEIPTSDLALRVVQRDLRGFVTPSRTFSLTTTRKPYGWRPNTYFRLQSVKRGIADMVCLLAEKSTGTLKSGGIKITASQDVYSLPSASFVQGESGVDTRPPQIPLRIVNQAAFEASYIDLVRDMSAADRGALASDAGYLATVAADPSQGMSYAILVSTDGGSTYAGNQTGDWCPSALIVEGDPLQNAQPRSAFTLTGGSRLAQVAIGAAALWDDEIVRVDALDVVAGTVTLGRGCADAVPQPHAPGSRIWFYDGASGTDATEYTAGETINAKLLTNTGTQQFDQTLATPLSVTFAGRQFAPYPPARLQINGAWYPEVIDGALAFTWTQRDRVLQADQLVDTMQPDVGPEAGATTTVRIYDDVNALLHTEAAIAADGWSWPLVDDAGSSRVPDPYWSSVKSLLHFDGADGSNTFTDEKGLVWTPDANAKISTAQRKFGGASGYFDGSGTCSVRTPALTGFGFDGDGTLDMWLYPLTQLATAVVFSNRGGTVANTFAVVVTKDGRVGILVWNNARAYFETLVPIAANTWTHVEIARSGMQFLVFVDGTLMASATVSGSFTPSGACSFSPMLSSMPGTVAYTGYIDDFRYTNGVVRHTSNFVVPIAPYGSTIRSGGAVHGFLRAEIESSRAGVASFQRHNVTIRRAGYGFNYGLYYGNATPQQRGQP